MGLTFDKFTWAVIGVVVLLLVGAVVTVNLKRNQPNLEQNYVSADSPTTPVQNAFIAFQKGDLATARAQYSTELLDAMEKNKTYTPFRDSGYINDRTSRRLRIISSRISDTDAKRATVTVAVDTYSSGHGLFDNSSTYSSQRIIEVVREANQWKINVPEFFNY